MSSKINKGLNEVTNSPSARAPSCRRAFSAWLCLVLLAMTSGAVSGLSEREELPDFGDSSGAIISPEQEQQLGDGLMRWWTFLCG
jgi:predicted Zn-dependent protease